MSGKRVAILQSNYIPWKGYFDLINSVDEFILFDQVLYTKRDWRNRNKIKTAHGELWLSIPVKVKGRFTQRIEETEVSSQSWREEHWKSLVFHYGKAPFFNEFKAEFEKLYLGSEETNLSRINYSFLTAINSILNIRTKISWSSDYQFIDGKSERLLSLCEQAKATLYLSGPAAKSYLDETIFHAAGIDVAWMDYTGYPEYPQFHPPFQHGVSVLDLLFHTGRNASQYMLTFGGQLEEHAVL